MTRHIKTWQDRLGNSAHIKSGGAVGEAMQAEIDELRAALEQPASALLGWYCMNADGMATLCASKEDALGVAESSNVLWPHVGPHRAVQLCEYAAAPTGEPG